MAGASSAGRSLENPPFSGDSGDADSLITANAQDQIDP
jgi:hypothetical protein